LYEFLRQLYLRLPLSPGLRYRIGHLRRRWMRRGLVVQQVDAAALLPLETALVAAVFDAPKTDDLAGLANAQPDWVFFGVIDWHFRHQRPQQLALALARAGRRVFYVSVNFVDSAHPGFELERLDPDLPLFQVFFNLPGLHSVYAGPPSQETLDALRAGQLALWERARIRQAVHVVQHPYWFALAAFLPPARLVYDCMDFHAGFQDTGDEHAGTEERLFALADLTIVTSDYLADHAMKAGARKMAIIRNGAEYDHFRASAGRSASNRPWSDSGRQVLGYYGAIAEWFDAELVARLSAAFPHTEIVLIGADTAGVGKRLSGCANVHLTGEKPYAELPQWLAGFDVCLIPFRVTELTLATNPVKAYEYLSAGKPVVSVDLPELQQFGDLVYRARDADEFMTQVAQALAETVDMASPAAVSLRQRRTEFAAGQTWAHRASDLLSAADDRSTEPSVSVVVVAYNQWALTERCLTSLVEHDDAGPLQIIVVDNASADQTPQRLRAWADADPARRHVILNADNRGFGPAVNQGLAAASGEYLVVLNNDTIVGPGWTRGMRRHFEVDPGLGLICPITNNIGNEAQVALPGRTPEEVFLSARRYCFQRSGRLLPLPNVAFFSVMIPRRVYEAVGPLDEQFVPGFFEDDDYCLRVREKGFAIGCAEDVFVYHELSASFDAEGAIRRQAIFDRNKALFEKKWGTWKPHVYRAESRPRP
jgi:GT2 family glycosyltransferase/glycosyltransferase involved in cell wall biosynthesis